VLIASKAARTVIIHPALSLINASFSERDNGFGVTASDILFSFF
jgi:hypothetical protein